MPVEILNSALKLDMKFKKFCNQHKGKAKIIGVDATAAPGNKTL